MYACKSSAFIIGKNSEHCQLMVGGSWCLPVKYTLPIYLTARYHAGVFPLPGKSSTCFAKSVIKTKWDDMKWVFLQLPTQFAPEIPLIFGLKDNEGAIHQLNYNCRAERLTLIQSLQETACWVFSWA